MASELVPLKLKNGTESKVVFFLCENGSSPFDEFKKECNDKRVIEKMATAIEGVDRIGVRLARLNGRIKPLKQGKENDLYEIPVRGCTARAYSFLIDGELAIAIAFILPKTHQGQGKKVVNAGIERLKNKRPQLEKALKRRNHGKAI